jgi:DNA-binding sugar fermentation-stimulating protein
MLMKLESVVSGTVLKRPSASIKSPYVADVLLDDGRTVLAHSAALGCCGLSDKGATIWLQAMPTKKTSDTAKCSHRVCLSTLYDTVREKSVTVGIFPKYAEELAEKALVGNHIQCLQGVRKYRRETVLKVDGLVDSRFDFSGIDGQGCPFLMEIKNVPLADYEDCVPRKPGSSYANREFGDKVAYFPDGYRKKATDPGSPRALKHIRELTTIRGMSKTRCILCFVVQRSDVNRFTASVADPEYKAAFEEARRKGVEIVVMVVEWKIVEGCGCCSAEAWFVCDDLCIV